MENVCPRTWILNIQCHHYCTKGFFINIYNQNHNPFFFYKLKISYQYQYRLCVHKSYRLCFVSIKHIQIQYIKNEILEDFHSVSVCVDAVYYRCSLALKWMIAKTPRGVLWKGLNTLLKVHPHVICQKYVFQYRFPEIMARSWEVRTISASNSFSI